MHFDFKQFTVTQQEGVFKIGTDALLLGAAANVAGAERILDIGTGTGVIALMLAQRSRAKIDALEINPAAAKLAAANFAASPWKGRIKVYEKSSQSFSSEKAGEYDLVVSNPPFFNRSLRSENEAKNLARHTQSLTHPQLLQHSAALLKQEGRLVVILPVGEGLQAIKEARLCELFLERIIYVRPNPKKPANRLLITLCKSECNAAEEELIIRDENGNYSSGYQLLTRQFHTIFP